MSYKYSFKGEALRTMLDSIQVSSSKHSMKILSNSDMFKPLKFENKKVKVTIEVIE